MTLFIRRQLLLKVEYSEIKTQQGHIYFYPYKHIVCVRHPKSCQHNISFTHLDRPFFLMY